MATKPSPIAAEMKRIAATLLGGVGGRDWEARAYQLLRWMPCPWTAEEAAIAETYWHLAHHGRSSGGRNSRSVGSRNNSSAACRLVADYPLEGSINSKNVPSGSLKQKNLAPALLPKRITTGSETRSTPTAFSL